MTNAEDYLTPSHICHLDWGRRGARRAAERGDILIIVDVISFSSLVATALHHGGVISPCTAPDDPVDLARRIGGEAAVRRLEVPEKGRFSLSPLTYTDIEPGTAIAVYSPNGATCTLYAREAPYVFVGGLINAEAVAQTVAEIIREKNIPVTVIACGEREKSANDDGPIRWAVEDYLGAGAILSHIPFAKSPDARVCEAAYLACGDQIDRLLWDCPSGRELRNIGFGADVEHCARTGIYDCVPALHDGCFVEFRRSPD